MGKLYERICRAVREDRFIVSFHADERWEERGVSAWQLVSGLDASALVRERPRSQPNPSVVVRTELVDGSEVEVIWSWLEASQRAQLVTVYFGNEP
jgi:hypothetical protein